MAKYHVHVELSKQLPLTGSIYSLYMAYLVAAANRSEAKKKAELEAQAENPECRVKAYHAEEIT